MTFASMLVRLAIVAVRLGIEEVTFTWNIRDWSPGAPNEGRRWSVQCGPIVGDGHNGEEALNMAMVAAESRPWR